MRFLAVVGAIILLMFVAICFAVPLDNAPCALSSDDLIETAQAPIFSAEIFISIPGPDGYAVVYEKRYWHSSSIMNVSVTSTITQTRSSSAENRQSPLWGIRLRC